MKTFDVSGGTMVVLARGEEVLSTLTAFAKERGITAAVFSGIGAVEDVRLCFYDLSEKTYLCDTLDRPHEVASMNGNISMRDGAPFVHVHAVLGERDLRVIGGHVLAATVAVTLELFVQTLEGAITRRLDDDIGLHLITE